MSGLVTFFKDFFPEVQNTDYSRSLGDVQAEECLTVHRSDTPLNADPLEQTPQAMTLYQWRRMQKQWLSIFFQKRLGDEEEEEEEEEEDSDGWKEADSGEDDDLEGEEQGEDASQTQHTQKHMGVEESQESTANVQWESQPSAAENDGSRNDKSKNGKRKAQGSSRRQNRKIPHLTQAMHNVTTLQYVDFYTSTMDFSLCRIHKIWTVRNTKRGLQQARNSDGGPPAVAPTTHPVYPGHSMPRIPFGFREEDGPVATLYPDVMSLEIEQMSTTGVPVPTGYSQKQRIRLFLYPPYSTLISKWMVESQRNERAMKRRQKKNKEATTDVDNVFFLAVSKLPGVCVFPFASNPHNWLQQESLLDVCLCVGGLAPSIHHRRRAVSPEEKEQEWETLRLDSDDMELRLIHAPPIPVSSDDDDDDETRQKQWAASTTTATGKDCTIKKSLIVGDGKFVRLVTPATQGGNQDSSASTTVHDDDVLWKRWKEYCDTHSPVEVENEDDGPMEGVVVEGNRSETAAAATTRAELPTGEVEQRQRQQQGNQATTRAGTNQSLGEGVSSSDQTRNVVEGTATNTRTATADETMPAGERARESSYQRERMEFLGPATKHSRGVNATYTHLGQLANVFQTHGGNKSINTFAVVLGFASPSQTKRGDWMMNITMIDQSSSEKPVTLVIFCKESDHLPKLLWMGDVIRVNRAAIGMWKGDVQVTGRKYTSFLAIRKTNETWSVNSSTEDAYVFDKEDEVTSQSLWYWGQTLITHQTSINAEHRFILANMITLRDDDEDKLKDRDLTVMITGKIPYPPIARTNASPHGYIRVWDGTGPGSLDPIPNRTLTTETYKTSGEPPLEAVSRAAYIIQQLQKSNRTEGLQNIKGLCGHVANAWIWEKSHWELIQGLSVGTFVRLRNVSVQRWQEDSHRSLMVHSHSWLTPIPDEAFEVQQLFKEHNERVKCNEYSTKSAVLSPNMSVPSSQGFLLERNVGSDLVAFVRSSDSAFEGAIQFVDSVPAFNGSFKSIMKPHGPEKKLAYRFGVRISDHSGSVDALIGDNDVGEDIVGVPAFLASSQPDREDRRLFQRSSVRKVRIRRVSVGGYQYFVVTGVASVDDN